MDLLSFFCYYTDIYNKRKVPQMRYKLLVVISICFLGSIFSQNRLFSSKIQSDIPDEAIDRLLENSNQKKSLKKPFDILSKEEVEYLHFITPLLDSQDEDFFKSPLFFKKEKEYIQNQGKEYLACFKKVLKKTSLKTSLFPLSSLEKRILKIPPFSLSTFEETDIKRCHEKYLFNLQKTIPCRLYTLAQEIIKHPLSFIPISPKIYNYFCKHPLIEEKDEFLHPIDEGSYFYASFIDEDEEREISTSQDEYSLEEETPTFDTPLSEEYVNPIFTGFSPLKSPWPSEIKAPFCLSLQQELRFYVINEEPYVTLTRKNAEYCDVLLNLLDKKLDLSVNFAQEHFENAIKTFGMLKKQALLKFHKNTI